MKIENHKIMLDQNWNLRMIFKIKLKITLLKKHRLFVDLVGFAMNLRDIMDFS